MNELVDLVLPKLKTCDVESFKRVSRSKFHVSLALVDSAEIDGTGFIVIESAT